MGKWPVGIKAAWIIGSLGLVGVLINALVSKSSKLVSISGDNNQVLIDSTIIGSDDSGSSIKETLSELNDKTSGIIKLPDGRIRFGRQIAGAPSVVLESHEAARRAFKSQDYVSALTHSSQAIRAYEETGNIIELEMTKGGYAFEGELAFQEVSKLYWLAAGTAQRLGRRSLADEYSKLAFDYIGKAIRGEPNDLELRQLKDKMFPGLKGS